MKPSLCVLLVVLFLFASAGCTAQKKTSKRTGPTAAEILGNPAYPAFSYGGFRKATRNDVPTVDELKEDMKILSAMGVKLIRTYNTQQYADAARLLQAIRELKQNDPDFEMYVMLGTWIECQGAWSSSADHRSGNEANNQAEIDAAVRLVNEYPDIVKVIAVGNESMVQWAINYFVYPNVILRWVNYLQNLKQTGGIPASTWITSSDNYESWGGGAANYQTDTLALLIEAVDFVSMHTYPFHDSHYQPAFWGVPAGEESLPDSAKIEAAMLRASTYAQAQYQQTADYLTSLGIKKSIHIGETGWSTVAAASYGASGSRAADEYKEKLYFDHMRAWTRAAGISCFYFEAFDEQWKDPGDLNGSENHFGLINLQGQAKYALWDMVDQGVFAGLTRNGQPITKTYGGNKQALWASVQAPPLLREMGLLETTTVNTARKTGEPVTESQWIIAHESLVPDASQQATYPSAKLKLNPWEGTCSIEMSGEGIIEVTTGTGNWWGCALEIQGGKGENLSAFAQGFLHFQIKGYTASSFDLGFQTGSFAAGDQVNNFVTFGIGKAYVLQEEWTDFIIPISELNKGANLQQVTGAVFFRGSKDFDGKQIFLKNIYYLKQ